MKILVSVLMWRENMFQLFHKAEKKKSFDAVVKDEKRKNTISAFAMLSPALQG